MTVAETAPFFARLFLAEPFLGGLPLTELPLTEVLLVEPLLTEVLLVEPLLGELLLADPVSTEAASTEVASTEAVSAETAANAVAVLRLVRVARRRAGRAVDLSGSSVSSPKGHASPSRRESLTVMGSADPKNGQDLIAIADAVVGG